MGVQSRFRVIYICRYVCHVLKCVGGITYAHAQSQFWAVKTDRVIHLDYTLEEL